MVTPLSIFAAGVLVAGLAAAATYIAQAGYGKEFGRFSRKIGVIDHRVALFLALGFYGLFGYGIFECAKTLAAGGT